MRKEKSLMQNLRRAPDSPLNDDEAARGYPPSGGRQAAPSMTGQSERMYIVVDVADATESDVIGEGLAQREYVKHRASTPTLPVCRPVWRCA